MTTFGGAQTFDDNWAQRDAVKATSSTLWRILDFFFLAAMALI